MFKKIAKRIFKGIAILFCLLLVSGVATWALNRSTVSRVDLGLNGKEGEETCSGAGPTFYPHPMRSEQAAEDHFVYGLASLNSYKYTEDSRFNMNKYPEGGYFSYHDFQLLDINGPMYFDVHTSTMDKTAANVNVIVAFRGTRGFQSLADWNANLSWFTGFLPFENSYAIARREFMRLRSHLAVEFPVAKIKYVSTGHSLGGALAMHVASSFPCVDSVVFDTSFVANEYILQQPFEFRTASIYEKGDELTALRHFIFGGQVDTPLYRWYPINVNRCNKEKEKNENGEEYGKEEQRNIFSGITDLTKILFCENFQHNMRMHVVGMSRLVGDCQTTNKKDSCRGNVTQKPAAIDIYCRTYGAPNTNLSDPEVCCNSWARQGIEFGSKCQ